MGRCVVPTTTRSFGASHHEYGEIRRPCGGLCRPYICDENRRAGDIAPGHGLAPPAEARYPAKLGSELMLAVKMMFRGPGSGYARPIRTPAETTRCSHMLCSLISSLKVISPA